MADVDVPKLLQALDIPVVKRSGPELWSTCPLHKDRHPSWSINVHSGLHSCFSCKFGGTAVDLVLHCLDTKRLGWGYREAYHWMKTQGLLKGELPPSFHVQLVLRSPPKAKRFQLPPGVEQEPLHRWPTLARQYAIKRGITPDQVQRWGLGYAVHGRLEQRIVFPFENGRGDLQSYSARSFVDAPLRYLTPARTEGETPGAIFGERHWPATWERDVLLVCEGAIDAIVLERALQLPVAGIPGVKRALNTRLLAKLSLGWRRLVLFTDNDRAGDWAADELRAALGRHTQVTRATLPDGKDAADSPVSAIVHAYGKATDVLGYPVSREPRSSPG